MDHDNFLLVTPEGWTEVQNASALVRQGGMDENQLATLIAGHDWPPVTQWAEDVNLIQSGQVITDARIFDLGTQVPGEINIRLFVIIA